ncbi:hypothetical protein CFP56_011830, partial [Quercus suber]
INGRTIVKPPRDAAEERVGERVNYLVGQFVDKSLPFHLVKNFVDHQWSLFGKVESLILHKWQPGLQAVKFNLKRILIWIKMFHLSVEYWNPECLSHIAGGVGIPLYTDSLTEKQKWLGFEGLCGN